MSTSDNQALAVDFSKLKFSVEEEDNEEDNEDFENEYAFTKEYKFTIDDPNPPPPPPPPPVVEEEDQDTKAPHDPQDLLSLYLRQYPVREYTPPPEPLVTIQVRTINRAKIPPGEFYIYMDEICEDFLQFSMGVFNKNGHIKPSLYKPRSLDRGTGVWGAEINKGILAYIEEIRVDSSYQRKGLGRWAIENLLNSDALAHCPFFFVMPGVINNGSPFDPPDPNFESKKQGVVSFWRSVGFRRVAGTHFFGYARNPNHPMRSLNAEDDAEEKENLKDFTPLDAHAS